MIADNAINSPQRASAAYPFRWTDGNDDGVLTANDFVFDGVMMSLTGTIGVENYNQHPESLKNCGATNSGRGCIRQAGGIIEHDLSPTREQRGRIRRRSGGGPVSATPTRRHISRPPGVTWTTASTRWIRRGSTWRVSSAHCRPATDGSSPRLRPGLRLLHRLNERREDLEHVADDPVVGDLEDRGFLVLVDRDDRLATCACRRDAGSRRRCRTRRRAAGSPGGRSGRSDRCAAASRRRSRRASRPRRRCRMRRRDLRPV